MERMIELSKMDEDGVVIEEQDEFKQSAFSAVYEKAELLLKDIIRQNEALLTSHREKNLQGEINNIISFEGRRGTGKTSVMLSVRKALEKFSDKPYFVVEDVKDQPSFVTLNHIDASLLEKDEGIVELILANMFTKLLERDKGDRSWEQNEYSSKELYQLFEKAYGSLLSLKSQNTNHGSVSPLRVLNELSSSQSLGITIKELVDKYLAYMSGAGKGCRSQSCFLVISIDDIDMNIEGSENSDGMFEMLENIHRYLMIPNVILLLAYNYQDLYAGCERHFYNMFERRWQSKEDIGEIRKHVKAMTVEYLKKVVPIYSRVYMPSLRKKDYADDNVTMIRVRYEEYEGSKTYRELGDFKNHLCGGKGKEAVLPIKTFALLLKAFVAGLYYDANGDKKHFSVPSSLREMVQSYQFFKRINVVLNEKREEVAAFKELLDDLYFRFATEKLSRRELEALKRYLDVSIKRRSRDILREIQSIYDEKDMGEPTPNIMVENETIMINGSSQKSPSRFSQITYIGERVPSYSYGELLYGLYQASKNGWYSKEFIWCILNSYTIMLTKLYRKMKYAVVKEEFSNCREEFAQIIGTSVAGSWSNLFTPKLQRSSLSTLDDEMEQAKGGKDKEYWTWKDLQNTSLISAAAVKHSLSVVEISFAVDFTQSAEKLAEELQMFEILSMFFTNVSQRGSSSTVQEGFEISYAEKQAGGSSALLVGLDSEDSQQEEEKKTGDLVFRCTDCCFNIMNFVTNQFLWDSFFEPLHACFANAYRKYYDAKKNVSNNMFATPEEIHEFIRNHSIRNEYDSWYQKYKGFSMPLYSFDMMYNVLKRQYQRQGVLMAAVPRGKFWGHVENVYDGIGRLLMEEEKFYLSAGRDGTVPANLDAFAHAYRESPFIHYIKNLGNSPERKKQFKKRFEQIIYSCCISEVNQG